MSVIDDVVTFIRIVVASFFVGSVVAVVRSIAATSVVDANTIGDAFQLPIIATD
jgi:hypothetical protein